MQQAVYDSETFARVDSDSDIYTYNRSIMAVKEYFSSWEYRMVRIYLENMVPSDVSNAVRKRWQIYMKEGTNSTGLIQ